MGERIKMVNRWILCFLMCMPVFVLLASCGREEKDTGYYIIEASMERVFNRAKSDAEVFLLGTRFYHDEPVQLVGYRNRDPETGERYINVSLCHTSGEEERLWERVPEEYGFGSWYLDEDGNGYCFYLNEVIRYDMGGSERYHKIDEEVINFTGACIRDKGDILLLGQTQQGMLNLFMLVPDTGEISRTGVTLDTENTGLQGKVFLAGNGKGFLVLDSDGIWEGDTEKGRKECIMSFKGGTYVPEKVTDFRALQDGTAQILCGSIMETVRSVDISRERRVLVLRVTNMDYCYLPGWLPEGIVRFNKENGEYYVVVEERQDGEDGVKFRERTDMELALGKGPDIVIGILKDPLSLVEKGALEDLEPYMEVSGIREEDYFPGTFDHLSRKGEQGTNSGVYGINPVLCVTPGIWVSRDLFPDGVENGLGAEGLVSALEAYEGDGVYTRTSSGLMDDLLSASDSLCGMVDWESRTCDFTGGMLKRILELCNRYNHRTDEDASILSGRMLSQLYIYANIYGNEEEMAEREMAALGCLFDDGCHAGIDDFVRMSVSSTSSYKEGAWEFIRFLLSERLQLEISWVENDMMYPSSRKAFDELAKREMTEGGPMADVLQADGTTIKKDLMSGFGDDVKWYERNMYYALTEDKVENVRKMLEGARAYPLRTEPIMDIIREEAAAYFAGDRSVEDVCANIQNRVQLYLGEQK